MKTHNLEIHYDTEADLLEIFLGEPTPSTFDEIDDDLFEGRDEQSNELTGYKIFGFLKRGGMRDIKITLPARVVIKSI